MHNARRTVRIIESDSTSHFETPQSHGNDWEARKLGSKRIEAERCWTAFLCLWIAASKTESEAFFTPHIFHRECPDMPPRRRPDRIFTVPRLCSAFGGTSSVWCIMSCWNRVKPSQGITIECNWCVWADDWRRSGNSTKRNTTKLSSSLTMPSHVS